MATSSLKDALRQQILAARSAISEDDWRESDARRTAITVEMLEQRRPGTLAIYASRPGEPGTHDIIDGAIAAGWQVLVPWIGRHVAWAPFPGWDKMVPGWRGIPQPTTAPHPAGALAAATIIITSCLAASVDGFRLGNGGGWYDRALPHRRSGTAVWTLARSVEILDQIPTSSYDVAINAAITEAGFRSLG